MCTRSTPCTSSASPPITACATAEDAQAGGYEMTVFENLCAGVAEQTTVEQLTTLHGLHVHLRHTKAVA